MFNVRGDTISVCIRNTTWEDLKKIDNTSIHVSARNHPLGGGVLSYPVTTTGIMRTLLIEGIAIDKACGSLLNCGISIKKTEKLPSTSYVINIYSSDSPAGVNKPTISATALTQWVAAGSKTEPSVSAGSTTEPSVFVSIKE